MYKWKKKYIKEDVKVVLEEYRRMGMVQTRNPQTVGREWIFSEKIQIELHVYWAPAYETSSALSIFHWIKSCDTQILEKEMLKVFKWGRGIFSVEYNVEASLRGKFLKHPVGDSSTYDLNSVMIVQTLASWTKRAM